MLDEAEAAAAANEKPEAAEQADAQDVFDEKAGTMELEGEEEEDEFVEDEPEG